MTITEVRSVHQQVMQRVWDVAPHPDATQEEGPGSFRRHDIRAFDGGMRPPPWIEVPERLSTWVDEVNLFAAQLSSLTWAPWIHAIFRSDSPRSIVNSSGFIPSWTAMAAPGGYS